MTTASTTPATTTIRPRNWALRALVVGAIVIPAALFAVIALTTYRTAQTAATETIERQVAVLREHAMKVFESADLLAIAIDQLTAGMTNEDVEGQVGPISAFLRQIIARLPQAQNIWVVDALGNTMLAVPPSAVATGANHADEEYFASVRAAPRAGLKVSRVQPRLTPESDEYFVLSRARIVDGLFGGVVAIAMTPDYFESVYAEIAGDTDLIAGLLRNDGTILALHPYGDIDLAAVPANEAFAAAIAETPERGTYTITTQTQGVWRISFYRVGTAPVYVAAALSVSDVTGRWLNQMAITLAIGLPFLLALAALGIIALRRTQREAAALAQLQAEIVLRELTEERLRQAGKMEAVGQLSGGIAHDFNNLLTAIGGNLELLAKRLPAGSENLGRLIESARQGVVRAGGLTQRLLAFSRRQALQPTAVDPNRLVTGMSDILHRTLGEHIEIEVVLGTGTWKTFVDANQLENAILNLAINARDAMQKGGRLTIETANTHIDEGYLTREGLRDVTPGQYVLVAVSDTGTGMPKDVIERAFEPFFTTKPPGEGTGLGLSMVYGFVKQSGGHAKIYSEIGHGTTIRLYLPRAKGTEAEAPPLPAERSEPGHGETILVVEDDAGVLDFEVQTLTEAGYKVRHARSGVEALAAIEADPAIDLLLSDVVLTGSMNGRQVADRATAAIPGLKVLFVTGYTQNAIVHHGRLDPGVQLLSKPFSTNDLLRRIRRILDAAT